MLKARFSALCVTQIYDLLRAVLSNARLLFTFTGDAIYGIEYLHCLGESIKNTSSSILLDQWSDKVKSIFSSSTIQFIRHLTQLFVRFIWLELQNKNTRFQNVQIWNIINLVSYSIKISTSNLKWYCEVKLLCLFS